MESLQHIDAFYIQIFLIIAFVIGHLIVNRKKDLKLILQYNLWFYGIIMLILSLSIPHVFPGYPYDISDLENKKRLLYHLQKNNEAIVKTTEAVRMMGFITFIFLLSTISKTVKHLKMDKSVE
jgi:hypothetical protein